MRRLREWAGTLKRESLVLFYAARDPRTPLAAKVVAALVVAYALSPIDLIPDFVPVLGYLDDLLLLPLGIWLALRLVPAKVLDDARMQAGRRLEQPTSRAGAALVVLLWIAALGVVAWLAYTYGCAALFASSGWPIR